MTECQQLMAILVLIGEQAIHPTFSLPFQQWGVEHAGRRQILFEDLTVEGMASEDNWDHEGSRLSVINHIQEVLKVAMEGRCLVFTETKMAYFKDFMEMAHTGEELSKDKKNYSIALKSWS